MDQKSLEERFLVPIFEFIAITQHLPLQSITKKWIALLDDDSKTVVMKLLEEKGFDLFSDMTNDSNSR